MRRLCLVILLVCLIANTANAAWYWVDGTGNTNWSDANNWHDGTVSPPASQPHSATESMRIPQGTVTANMDDTMGYIMMSRDDGVGGPAAIGNVTLNLNSSRTLKVSTGSSELVSVAFSSGVTNNLNVSSGKLCVWRGTGAGEIRLNHVYEAGCVGNLNLSGGVVDTEVLNKGDRTGGGTFTGTGGTLVIRDEIDKFGKLSDGAGMGFYLGGSTLEIAPIDTEICKDYALQIGDIEIGNSQDMDFLMSDDSTVVFDIGLSANNGGVAGTDYDYIGMEGDFTIDGTLIVNCLGTPSIGDYWDVWSVEYDQGSYDGTGSFDNIIVNGCSCTIVTSWEDSGVGTHDILRLTCVPEPATMALMALGLIAIRRRKK